MKTSTVWAFEDLRCIFTKKYLFTIVVRFHERTRNGYVLRQVKKQIEAPSMSEACTSALNMFADKSEVRVGGITLPKDLKLGSKRPTNPYLSKKPKITPSTPPRSVILP
jgi:hypothetical protein